MENYEKFIGQVFDNRYKIENVIGVGGMAVVFKAVDLLMRRMVAVKILREDISADEPSVQRFVNESKAVAMLSHPNIVNIYDVSVRDDVKYIVMEYIEGITLKSYIQRRQVLSFKEVVGYSIQILKALEHAHQKGIVHRDIKPQNIMLLKNGVIKVMDFGIAKLPNTDTVTMTDKAIGTVYYISPEQASGEPIDARSDLYSLGAMMYEMATGSLPFDAESPVSVALMQVNDTPTPPREVNSHVPPGLEQIILKAMEKDPSVRYQSASQMLSQLQKLRENPNVVFKPTTSEKFKKFFSKKFKKSKGSRGMFPMIMGIFVSFLIVFAVCGIYIFNSVLNSSSQKGYETITVDNFVSSRYSDELKEWFVRSDYYTVSEVEYKYDESVEAGTIIGQSPSEGVKKKVLPGKKPCRIKLVVSGGEEQIYLEDYSIRDYRLVVSELRKIGLKCNVEKVNSDTVEIGYVVATDPGPGSVVSGGDSVTVKVSSGPAEGDIKTPDFVGKNEAETLRGMRDKGLTVGNVTYMRSDKEVGTVIQQSILPDTMIVEGTVIDFTVSGGPTFGSGENDDSDSEETTEKMKPPVIVPGASDATSESTKAPAKPPQPDKTSASSKPEPSGEPVTTPDSESEEPKPDSSESESEDPGPSDSSESDDDPADPPED